MYKALRIILNLFFKLFFGLEVRGTENIPKEGGFLLCGNHVSGFDPLVIACPKAVLVTAMGRMRDWVRSLPKE